MRLIDFDALGVGKCNPDVFDDKGYANGWNSAIEILQDAPTVEAVPVVRCKDCRFWITGTENYFCDIDGQDRKGCWFCADGKRKGGNE